MKHIRWSFVDRVAAAVVFLGFALTGLWFTFPTSAFIRPISLSIQQDQVRFVRETPFGSVQARWVSEITLIDGDGFECNSGHWRNAEYQPIDGNTVVYQIGAWADRCIEAGPPFYLTTTRQVLLWGVIPLKPMRSTTEIQGERDPGVVIVIPAEQ